MALPSNQTYDIEIEKVSARISTASFHIPLIMGTNADFDETYRTYQNIAQVLEDFATNTQEYLAATSIFAQSPGPDTIVIGKRGTDVAQVDDITFNADFVAANSISLKINGVEIGPIVYGVSHLATITALAAAIEASPFISDATVQAGNRIIRITGQTAGIPFYITDIAVTLGASQATGVLSNVTPNRGIADDLGDLREIYDNWYVLIMTEKGIPITLEAAKYIETVDKMFSVGTSDDDTLDEADEDNVIFLLHAGGYNNSFSSLMANTNTYLDAGIVGKWLPYDPGTETLKFKQVALATVYEATQNQFSNLFEINGNVYAIDKGYPHYLEGKTASGHFVDFIRYIHYLKARLEESIFVPLIENSKVPYTDAGAGLIESVIRELLQGHVDQGKLTEYTVTVPLVSSMAAQDRAQRKFGPIKFTATTTSAFHNIVIRGTVVQ
jgi:hypothetical protein